LFTKCLEKSGKKSNFVLEKSGKPQSDFCTNPVFGGTLNLTEASNLQSCRTLSVRWKLSDGNSDTVAPPQLSDSQSVSVNTGADGTTRSSQLARIGVRAAHICSFIADQPTKDLDHYEECLELVSRGLVTGRVQVMVQRLRRVLDRLPTERFSTERLSTESSIAETVSTSCRRPSLTSADGNINFVILIILVVIIVYKTRVGNLQHQGPDFQKILGKILSLAKAFS